MELIVNLSVISVFIGLWMYARYWRRMCGKAFCQYAAACCGREEREKLMRYAIIAGNRHAPLLYALTYPERFDKARPLRLFEFRGIRCVFAGIIFLSVMKTGFVTTSPNLSGRCMISRKGETRAGIVSRRRSGFFPLPEM